MKTENEELSVVEMEYLLTLIANGSIYENSFLASLQDFSAGRFGKIEKADFDVVSGLEKKGMIEIEKGSGFAIYKSTQKGYEYAEKRVKSNWSGSDNYRRWRKVFFDTKQRMIRQKDGEIIMKMLLAKASVPFYEVRQKIKDMVASEIRNLASDGGFEWEGYPLKARRGVKFPQAVAKIIYSKELSGDLEEAGIWRKKIDEIISSLAFKDESQRKFDLAYREAVESNVCPVGLSEKCATEFKGDADCLTPQRHLSASDFTFTVKSGFSYRDMGMKRLKYTTRGIVMEVSQPRVLAFESNILIRRPIVEMVKIFQNVMKEFEKMSKETRIGFSGKTNPIGIKVEFENDYAILKFPVLVEDKKSKISFASFKEAEDILKKLQKK